jgi:hypothetical protein
MSETIDPKDVERCANCPVLPFDPAEGRTPALFCCRDEKPRVYWSEPCDPNTWGG